VDGAGKDRPPEQTKVAAGHDDDAEGAVRRAVEEFERTGGLPDAVELVQEHEHGRTLVGCKLELEFAGQH
jgi:hypothetical protein